MSILVVAFASVLMSVGAPFLPKAGTSSSAVREALAKPVDGHTLVVALTSASVFGGLSL